MREWESERVREWESEREREWESERVQEWTTLNNPQWIKWMQKNLINIQEEVFSQKCNLVVGTKWPSQ